MTSLNPDTSRIFQSLIVWDQVIYNDLCKKGLLWEGSASSRPHLLVSWILPWLILASGHRFHSLCFCFCRPAGRGWEAWHCCHLSGLCFQLDVTRREPIWHSQRKTHGFLEATIYWNAARKENSCRLFCDQFLPLVIHPIGRQTVSHFECSDQQRAMQFIVGRWWYMFCIYMCVFHLFFMYIYW